MRVNVYAEEMTDRIEIVEKETKDGKFTGLRIYLELPVSRFKHAVFSEIKINKDIMKSEVEDLVQLQGPFIHHEGDDDSSAVTFWGKADLRITLDKAMKILDEYYFVRNNEVEKDRIREKL